MRRFVLLLGGALIFTQIPVEAGSLVASHRKEKPRTETRFRIQNNTSASLVYRTTCERTGTKVNSLLAGAGRSFDTRVLGQCKFSFDNKSNPGYVSPTYASTEIKPGQIFTLYERNTSQGKYLGTSFEPLK